MTKNIVVDFNDILQLRFPVRGACEVYDQIPI